MPMPWVWSPAAEAAEKEYRASDERRKQRQADAGALQRTQLTGDLALRNLIEGKKYEEGAAERAGTAEMEALNQFLERSPDIAKRAGLTRPTMAFTSPEEGSGMQPTQQFDRFQPPARGAKTIADLVKGRITETGKPIVLPRGAKAITPEGDELGSNEVPSMTLEQANRTIAENEAKFPETRGRWTVHGDSFGGYQVNRTTTEQLTESLPMWISQYTNPKATPEEKVILQSKIDKYVAAQEKIQFGKTRATVQATPMSNEQQMSMNQLLLSSATLRNIRTLYTPEEVRLYTGLAGYKGTAANILKGVEDAGIPGVAELAATTRKALGGSDAVLERFNQFQVLNDNVRKSLSFIEGGKQLTGIELAVVTGTIPQKNDWGNVWMTKARILEEVLSTSAEVRQQIQLEGKVATDVAAIEAAFRMALARKGIDADNPLNSSGLGTPDDRARAKWDKNKRP